MYAEGQFDQQRVSIGKDDSVILLPQDDPITKPGENNFNYMEMKINGVTIHYTKEVEDKHGQEMRDMFEESFSEIERLVPSDAWNIMKTTDIYVNDK